MKIFDFELIPIGNKLGETRIAGVRGLKGRRPNSNKVSSGFIQIRRLTFAKPAVGIFVAAMHHEHHRNTGSQVC